MRDEECAANHFLEGRHIESVQKLHIGTPPELTSFSRDPTCDTSGSWTFPDKYLLVLELLNFDKKPCKTTTMGSPQHSTLKPLRGP